MSDGMMCLSEIPYDIIMRELAEINARINAIEQRHEAEDVLQMEADEYE
jgi:hypothetical protein